MPSMVGGTWVEDPRKWRWSLWPLAAGSERQLSGENSMWEAQRWEALSLGTLSRLGVNCWVSVNKACGRHWWDIL